MNHPFKVFKPVPEIPSKELSIPLDLDKADIIHDKRLQKMSERNNSFKDETTVDGVISALDILLEARKKRHGRICL